MDICPAGKSPRTLYFNDMETSIADWDTGPEPGYTQGEAWQVEFYATSGIRSMWIQDPAAISYTRMALKEGVSLPAGSEAYLRFNHAYDLEGTQTGPDIIDGGQVRYSTTAGAAWTNATSLFRRNGYNGTVMAKGSPMDGQPAFGHGSFGYGTSLLDLSTLAGQSVRIGYWVATDATNRREQAGWFIDDVWIYTCEVTPTPTPWARAGNAYIASMITRWLSPTATPAATPTPTATVTPAAAAPSP